MSGKVGRVERTNWERRLQAIEIVLREQGLRTRSFPDYEHLDGLLRLQNVPEYFQTRVKQVIESVKERMKLEADPNSASLDQSGTAHPGLPLGPPEWFR